MKIVNSSKKLLLILLLLNISATVYADSLGSNVQMNYIGVIERAIPIWMDISNKTAIKIFTILWCFETFHQVIFKNVLGNNLKHLPVYFIVRICFGGFFYALLLKPDFYEGIIQFFGSQSTSISFDHNKISGFDAGWVFKQFAEWTTSVYNPDMNELGMAQIGQIITYGILYDVYMVCTCLISIMTIILEVQIYMTVFGALVLTGFAGSSWTYGIWNRYIDAVIGLGIRVMVFGMLYSILTNLIIINPSVAGSMDITSSTISIILVTACLWIIPSQISSMVSGSSAGHSLAEAGATMFATMALGKRMMSRIPSPNISGSIGGVSSPSHDPSIPKSSINDLPNPSKSKSIKPMPPDWNG
ncbi:MAG: type IV secretion system protein [Burkholderiales bacterium]|nr:type IV secretion system protein [Burkholderiales bacterium]